VLPTGDNVRRRSERNISPMLGNSPVRFKIPFSRWLRDRNCSNLTQKSNRDSMSKDRILKNCISLKGNSVNGWLLSQIYWMMTVIPRKNRPMQDLKLNWSTGELGCRRSPIGVNNSKTRISRLWKICCSDNNNMMWDKEDMEKRFPSWLWITTD